MIALLLIAVLLAGVAIGWVGGIAYGVRREQDYQLAQARRRMAAYERGRRDPYR